MSTLHRSFESLGVQAEEFTDTATGRAIVRLTNNDLFNVHTYYDICPWSHDGRYLVFSGADPATITEEYGHDGIASLSGQVFVIDAMTREIKRVVDGSLFNMHSGAMCCWHPQQHVIFYRKEQENSASIDLMTREEKVFAGKFRQLSPDGELFATLLDGSHNGGQGAAIGLMRPDGTDARELVNRKKLWELTPNRDEFTPEDVRLGNTKWHPDSDHLLITMWVYPKPGSRRSLYVIRKDGSDARWLGYFNNHHSWTPSGDAVLCNDHKFFGPDGERRDMRLFLLPFDGGERKLVIDEPVGSHPLMHADGNRIVDFDREGIVLVHIDEQRVERLAKFDGDFAKTHKGTHAHPVWSRDGKEVLYNSAETGLSQLYLLSGLQAPAERKDDRNMGLG